MICSKEQRALRSGNQKDHPDRCFGKVFSVKGLGKSDCFCIRHYEKIRERDETKCCFPLSLASGNCSGRLIKCPQRLVAVFQSLSQCSDIFLNPHICNKHLNQADKQEEIICNKHYISPRKVRSASIYLSTFNSRYILIWYIAVG